MARRSVADRKSYSRLSEGEGDSNDLSEIFSHPALNEQRAPGGMKNYPVMWGLYHKP